MTRNRWLSLLIAAALVFAITPAAFASDSGHEYNGRLSFSGPSVVVRGETYQVTLTYTGDEPVDVRYRCPGCVLEGAPTHFDGPGSSTFPATITPQDTSPGADRRLFCLAFANLADGTELDAEWVFEEEDRTEVSAEPTEAPSDEPSEAPGETASERPSGEPGEVPSSEPSATASVSAPAQAAGDTSASPSKPSETKKPAATKKPVAAGKDKLPKTGDTTMDLWVLVLIAGACAAAAVLAGCKLRRSAK